MIVQYLHILALVFLLMRINISGSSSIYVYPIPDALLNIPKGKQRKQARYWAGWQDIERVFYENLKYHYNHIATNPELADWYFIPNFVTYRYHYNKNKTESSEYLLHIVNYVTNEFPFFNRSNGIDHFTVWAHDTYGNVIEESYFQQLTLFRKNVVKIANQGDSLIEDFVPSRDICVIPSSYHFNAENRPPWSKRKYLFSFVGTFHTDFKYSNGVRQKLLKMYSKFSTDVIFKEKKSVHRSFELKAFQDSKFCLFIRGWQPWSERLASILLSNCIPVIIADSYVLPFWQVVNWKSIAVRFLEKDVLTHAKLYEILAKFNSTKAIEMESNIITNRENFTYNVPFKSGDAFAISMELLKRKTSAFKVVSNVAFVGN